MQFVSACLKSFIQSFHGTILPQSHTDGLTGDSRIGALGAARNVMVASNQGYATQRICQSIITIVDFTHREVVGEGGARGDAALSYALHAVMPLAVVLSNAVPGWREERGNTLTACEPPHNVPPHSVTDCKCLVMSTST